MGDHGPQGVGYDELRAAWEGVRVKPNALEPTLFDEPHEAAARSRTLLGDGQNDEFRALLRNLRERIEQTTGARQNVLRFVAILLDARPFEVNDPAYKDEPLALRMWRTVEYETVSQPGTNFALAR